MSQSICIKFSKTFNLVQIKSVTMFGDEIRALFSASRQYVWISVREIPGSALSDYDVYQNNQNGLTRVRNEADHPVGDRRKDRALYQDVRQLHRYLH